MYHESFSTKNKDYLGQVAIRSSDDITMKVNVDTGITNKHIVDSKHTISL